MSRFKNIRSRICSHEVPVVPLGELGTWYGGGTPSKAVPEYWQNGTVPWLSPKDMTDSTVLGTEDHITELALTKSSAKLVPAGSVAFVMRSNILRRRLPIGLVPFEVALNQDMRAVVPHSGVLPEYLAHVCHARAQTILSHAGRTDGSMAAIQTSMLMNYAIPVPPVQLQHEIVQILDSFTALDAAILEELEVRERQRIALARTLPEAPYPTNTISSSRKLVRLGEVATQHVDPVRVQGSASYKNLGVRWYGEGAFARESKLGSSIKGTTLYRVKPQQFIYNRMFVTEGSFAIITPELSDGVVSNEFPVYQLDTSRVLPEWLLLYFKDEYTLKRIEGEVTGTERGSTKSRRRWREDQFEAFEIELPSISAQRAFLRTINAITALESTLRDELDARRKQYDYYRDELLTFKEHQA
ncbi:restriction endonuclease subunit S [Amycolatopsis sp. CB00013]|uniref:restriction endonuclease subunit S n=1 Tax=Amycolatopsis sp. CB00013 TaxID=1703945 RepID=UPI0009403EE8|nr:restriction endonuclease subunit S [Amycolatopsis sp. CB00013]